MSKSKIMLTSLLILTFLVNLVACGANKGNEKKKDAQVTGLSSQGTEKRDSGQTQGKQQGQAGESKSMTANNKGLGYRLSPEELNQSLVQGATPGSSRSDYVVDRKVWNDFMANEDQAAGEKMVGGVHVPKFLFDSEYAKEANAAIDAVVSNLKESYLDFQKYKNPDYDGDLIGISADFSVYQNQDFLSVHLTSMGTNPSPNAYHQVFNFSLPDGNALSDAELLSYFGLDQEDILSCMENAIVADYDAMDQASRYFPNDVDYLGNMGYLAGLTLQDLWANYKADNHVAYVDESGQARFIYLQFTMAGSGTQTNSLSLFKGSEYLGQEYSPQYIRMAKELGLDPDDPKIQGIMVYLGNGYDAGSIEDVLEKLFPWQAAYLDYQDPKMLLVVQNDTIDFSSGLAGQEIYLLVPKMKNASISLQELKISDSGTLIPVENYHLDNFAVTGPTLICQNESEIAPNAKITIQYRGDKLEFSPSISLKDGSLILPDEIYDGQKLMDWDGLKDKDLFSWYLRDNLFKAKGLTVDEGN